VSDSSCNPRNTQSISADAILVFFELDQVISFGGEGERKKEEIKESIRFNEY
jgi:hypothetical protein